MRRKTMPQVGAMWPLRWSGPSACLDKAFIEKNLQGTLEAHLHSIYLQSKNGKLSHVRWIQPRLGSYVWFIPWHPVNLRMPVLNRLLSPLFACYSHFPLGEAEVLVRQADLILFESKPG